MNKVLKADMNVTQPSLTGPFKEVHNIFRSMAWNCWNDFKIVLVFLKDLYSNVLCGTFTIRKIYPKDLP